MSTSLKLHFFSLSPSLPCPYQIGISRPWTALASFSLSHLNLTTAFWCALSFGPVHWGKKTKPSTIKARRHRDRACATADIYGSTQTSLSLLQRTARQDAMRRFVGLPFLPSFPFFPPCEEDKLFLAGRALFLSRKAQVQLCTHTHTHNSAAKTNKCQSIGVSSVITVFRTTPLTSQPLLLSHLLLSLFSFPYHVMHQQTFTMYSCWY